MPAQPAPPSAWTDPARPPLRTAALRRALVDGPVPVWRAVEVVSATGSTNADLVARARAGEPEGLVLAADHQTAGRGRHDRGWEAPPRAGIAVSVLLRPPVPTLRWGWLGLLAGVAAVDELRRRCGIDVRLKWPNDLLVADPDGTDRKLGGILAEAVPGTGEAGAGAAVVLGIGLNVDQERAELPVPGATSLRLAGAATRDREIVVRAVLRGLADRYAQWTAAGGDARACGLAAAYRERCGTLGMPVLVHLPGGVLLTGTADGVDDDGHLLVRDDAGADHALAAGDVVHVRPAGALPAVASEEA